ncbi:MAG: glucose-6-phosphate isomerase [Akkermansia sp.]
MKQYAEQLIRYSDLGISLDFSKLPITTDFLATMAPKIDKAFADIDALEAGAIANPDEKRMVGHYWLRNPDLAPTQDLKDKIIKPLEDIADFGGKILSGEIIPPSADAYTTALIIGIGGSALGPELIADAIPAVGLDMAFLDNTDPDGMYAVLETLPLEETLVVVISKSGGTHETRNGMLVTQDFFESCELDFAKQAIAVTGVDSKLDKLAQEEGWLHRFPMEDWVGGRTSVTSVVGLVPAVLQGVDIEDFLDGAAAMDTETRKHDVAHNAAMKLALAWYKATNGKGEKDMVVLPYKDSLVLFSKYLQQLIMESIGKKEDLNGKIVHQGLTVYGNKGSTDQHAYVQQLRDGVANFFAVLIEVREALMDFVEVEQGTTPGDYLQGFLRGTRQALAESGRESITISIPTVNAFSIGMLIALFERTVSFYASLVNINAYHQPGVEAGKKAASVFLSLLSEVRNGLTEQAETAEQVATRLGKNTEDVYHCLVHMASGDGDVEWVEANTPDQDTFKNIPVDEVLSEEEIEILS